MFSKNFYFLLEILKDFNFGKRWWIDGGKEGSYLQNRCSVKNINESLFHAAWSTFHFSV